MSSRIENGGSSRFRERLRKTVVPLSFVGLATIGAPGHAAAQDHQPTSHHHTDTPHVKEATPQKDSGDISGWVVLGLVGVVSAVTIYVYGTGD